MMLLLQPGWFWPVYRAVQERVHAFRQSEGLWRLLEAQILTRVLTIQREVLRLKIRTLSKET